MSDSIQKIVSIQPSIMKTFLQKLFMRKSPRLRNIELIKECLHLDLERVQRTGVIILPLRSYLCILFYVLHGFRFVTLTNANSTIRYYLGDHYQYFPPPAIFWYVLHVVSAVCIACCQGSFLIAIRMKRRAATQFAQLLFLIHSSKDSNQLYITSEDYETLSRRSRLLPDVINALTINVCCAMAAFHCYSSILSNNFTLLWIGWALVVIHYAVHFWRTVGCYLLNLDLICLLVNMRLQKVTKTTSQDMPDVNVANVKQLSDVHVLDSVVNKQILVYMAGFVPMVALAFTPALWGGHWLMQIALVLSFSTIGSFLAYIVYRTSSINKTIKQLYVRLSRISPQRGILFKYKYGIWRLMTQFRKVHNFGLYCGRLFVINKFVFVKVVFAVARFSILLHKLGSILKD